MAVWIDKWVAPVRPRRIIPPPSCNTDLPIGTLGIDTAICLGFAFDHPPPPPPQAPHICISNCVYWLSDLLGTSMLKDEPMRAILHYHTSTSTNTTNKQHALTRIQQALASTTSHSSSVSYTLNKLKHPLACASNKLSKLYQVLAMLQRCAKQALENINNPISMEFATQAAMQGVLRSSSQMLLRCGKIFVKN